MNVAVDVRPRASRVKVVKNADDSLKVYLTKPAVDGEANRQLISVLADYYDVARSAVDIVRGQSSKKKLIKIERNK